MPLPPNKSWRRQNLVGSRIFSTEKASFFAAAAFSEAVVADANIDRALAPVDVGVVADDADVAVVVVPAGDGDSLPWLMDRVKSTAPSYNCV